MNKQELDRYRSQGASALVDAYEKLASERDALSAHVERLRDVWQSRGGCPSRNCFIKTSHGRDTNSDCRCYTNRSKMKMLTQCMNAAFQHTPKTTLAERDAEVAKKAFVAGFNEGKIKRPVVDLRSVTGLAEQYANQLRAEDKE